MRYLLVSRNKNQTTFWTFFFFCNLKQLLSEEIMNKKYNFLKTPLIQAYNYSSIRLLTIFNCVHCFWKPRLETVHRTKSNSLFIKCLKTKKGREKNTKGLYKPIAKIYNTNMYIRGRIYVLWIIRIFAYDWFLPYGVRWFWYIWYCKYCLSNIFLMNSLVDQIVNSSFDKH